MEIHKGSLQKSTWMIPEFFPEVGVTSQNTLVFFGGSIQNLEKQTWISSPKIHRNHQSKMIAKQKTFATKQATWSQKKKQEKSSKMIIQHKHQTANLSQPKSKDLYGHKSRCCWNRKKCCQSWQAETHFW